MLKEQSNQNMYIFEKTSFFVDRERSLEILIDYVLSNKVTEEFDLVANDMGKIKLTEIRPNMPLIVLGDEGSGSKKTRTYCVICKLK